MSCTSARASGVLQVAFCLAQTPQAMILRLRGCKSLRWHDVGPHIGTGLERFDSFLAAVCCCSATASSSYYLLPCPLRPLL